MWVCMCTGAYVGVGEWGSVYVCGVGERVCVGV